MAITRRQALEYFQSGDIIGLGMEADAMRRRLHPEGVVTYSLDRTVDCSSLDSYSDSGFEAICEKFAGAIDLGSNAVRLHTGSSDRVGLAQLVNLLQKIKQRFPEIALQAFRSTEILALSGSSGLTLSSVLERLNNAGLDSLLGSPLSVSENWIDVHRAAHQAGMRTTANMRFGAGEPLEERMDLLESIHTLQEETGGFAAFVPVSFEPRTVAERDLEATAVEYLKVLAVSRLYLDNIENVQSSWAAQGLKVLQMGLRFGANDAGSVAPEENGAKATTEETLRHIIRDAGFRPMQRDPLYRAMFLN
jgi:cyclic dehypoxanthinyl futalosine synthase